MEAAVLIVCVTLLMVDSDTIKCDGQLLRPKDEGHGTALPVC